MTSHTHLAGLAVYDGHMLGALLEPVVDVLTEGLHELEAGRVVVVKGVGGDTRVEPADVITALGTPMSHPIDTNHNLLTN